jgi:hypothetical protein
MMEDLNNIALQLDSRKLSSSNSVKNSLRSKISLKSSSDPLLDQGPTGDACMRFIIPKPGSEPTYM